MVRKQNAFQTGVPAIASYFVYNRSNPVSSVHRAGVVLSTNATDFVTAVATAYSALHPLAVDDQLEITPASAIVTVRSNATFTFPASTPPALPDSGT